MFCVFGFHRSNERFESFKAANYPDHRATQFAQAGFYYMGPGDKVTCEFCGRTLKNWSASSRPVDEHAKHIPDCRFIEILRKKKLLRREDKGTISSKIQSDDCKCFSLSGEEYNLEGKVFPLCSLLSSIWKFEFITIVLPSLASVFSF